MNRRELLSYIGVGAGIGSAGCTDILDRDGNDSGTPDSTSPQGDARPSSCSPLGELANNNQEAGWFTERPWDWYCGVLQYIDGLETLWSRDAVDTLEEYKDNMELLAIDVIIPGVSDIPGASDIAGPIETMQSIVKETAVPFEMTREMYKTLAVTEYRNLFGRVFEGAEENYAKLYERLGVDDLTGDVVTPLFTGVIGPLGAYVRGDSRGRDALRDVKDAAQAASSIIESSGPPTSSSHSDGGLRESLENYRAVLDVLVAAINTDLEQGITVSSRESTVEDNGEEEEQGDPTIEVGFNTISISDERPPTFTISAIVENVGDGQADGEEVVISINSEVINTAEYSLSPGESDTIQLDEVSIDDEIGTSDTVTFTIESNDDEVVETREINPLPLELEIVSVAPEEPIQNSELTVEYTVKNPNEVVREETVRTFVNESPALPHEMVSLEGNETRTFSFDLFEKNVAYISPGEYEIRLKADGGSQTTLPVRSDSITVPVREAEEQLFETTIDTVAGRVEDPDGTVSRFLQDSIVVNVEVTHTGDIWTEQDIRLFVDDHEEPILENQLTLRPSESDTTQFSRNPDDIPELVPGEEHTLTVASESELSLESGSVESVTVIVSKE